jgi:hypothetical protein
MSGVVAMLGSPALRSKLVCFLLSQVFLHHHRHGLSVYGRSRDIDRRENRHPTRKTGGWVLSATTEKNTRTPKKILVVNGRILCPYCKHYIGRAVYGAKAGGIDVFCTWCKKHARIEL